MAKQKQMERLTKIVEGAEHAAAHAATRAETCVAQAAQIEGEVGAWLVATRAAVSTAKATCERNRKSVREVVAKGADKRLADAKVTIHALIREAVEAVTQARDNALAEIDAAATALDVAAGSVESSFSRVEALSADAKAAVQACNGARGSINDALTRLAAVQIATVPTQAAAVVVEQAVVQAAVECVDDPLLNAPTGTGG